MASISSLGSGSGLDLSGLLDKLAKAERRRLTPTPPRPNPLHHQGLTPYTTKQSSYNTHLTAYGTLKGVLERFDNLSKDLAKEETFKGTTAASEHDAFKITTNNKAVPGNYMVEVTKIVEVTKLAQAQTLTTQEKISNQTAKLGTHWRG